MKKKYTVVLDLDQTIISGEDLEEYKRQDWSSKEKKFRHATMEDYYIIFERPHLQNFLSYLFQNFNVIVWTAASKDYALFIIENMILKNHPERKLDWIFYTYHCDHSRELQSGIKDLRLLYENFDLPGLNRNNTIIIDDNDEVHSIQPTRAIHIPPFEFTEKGSENDKILLTIIDFLKDLKRGEGINTTNITEKLEEQYDERRKASGKEDRD